MRSMVSMSECRYSTRTPASARYVVRSSAIFLVSVVMSTRPPRSTSWLISERRSSIWPLGGPDLDQGIEEAGRSDDLIGDLVGHLELEGARCRRDEDRLGHDLQELLDGERPVVLGGGQAEAVLDQDVLSRAVTRELPSDLGHGHVALVDDHQEVPREEVEQRVGPLPWRTTVEVSAVVLDACADAGLRQHLEVVLGAGPEPLGLEQLALSIEERPAARAAHLRWTGSLGAWPRRPPRSAWPRRR